MNRLGDKIDTIISNRKFGIRRINPNDESRRQKHGDIGVFAGILFGLPIAIVLWIALLFISKLMAYFFP